MNNDYEDFPELNLEDENSFKNLKLSFYLPEDSIGPGNFSPQEESHFLDYFLDAYKKFEEVKKVTVYEKIGSPALTPESELSDEQVKFELQQLKKLLKKHKVHFYINYKYEDRIIYKFITTEFFNQLVPEVYYETPVTKFEYEQFYPNHTQQIKYNCLFLWEDFCDRNTNYFEQKIKKIKNAEELTAFRELFNSLTLKSLRLKYEEILIEGNRAVATVIVSFSSENKGKDLIRHRGRSKMEAIYNKKTNAWDVISAPVPIKIM